MRVCPVPWHQVETSLPCPIQLLVTGLHIGIMSTRFLDFKLNQKTEMKENHIKHKSCFFRVISVVEMESVSYLYLVEHFLWMIASFTPISQAIVGWEGCPSRYALAPIGWACRRSIRVLISLGTVIGQGWGWVCTLAGPVGVLFLSLIRTGRGPGMGREGRENEKQRQSRTETERDSRLVTSLWKPMSWTNERGRSWECLCAEGQGDDSKRVRRVLWASVC